MPGIQDIYSVNVSNRYELSNLSGSGEESDSAADYDPLDTLKNLEDEKKRALDEVKKKKQALATSKTKNLKKSARFQEIKESNVPEKRENTAATRPQRNARQRDVRTDKNRNARHGNADRQNYPEGDENRRPPRRRKDQQGTNMRSGEGDQLKIGKEDPTFGNYGRSGDDTKPERRDRVERYRGGRGGYRNFGGGYRGRGFVGHRTDGRDDRGKREFDRHSGSDRSSVRPMDKREGAGPRNWGTPGNELEEAVDSNPSATDEAGNWREESTSEEKEMAKDEQADTSVEKEVKEEPSEMTLDEWKAKQVSAPKNPLFNIRKPGEGENVEQWKNMKLLRKSDTAEDQAGNASKEQHKRQVKQQVNVSIQFGDNASRGFGGRGRGPRSDRGRGRGQRGQRFNPDRLQMGHQMLPDVQNEAEFPTLG